MNNARQGYTRQWLVTANKQRTPFADSEFETTFSTENVNKLLNELKAATEAKISASNRLIDEDYTYSVQVTSQQRPHVPVHLLRIELPHSVLGDDSAVCIFVRDQKRPAGARNSKNDYDHTIKHYEALFRTQKIEQGNITFMPISQFFNEYATFDQRRKLTFLFDKFMCDLPIATRVNAFLGFKLLQDGRGAFPVDLASNELPEEVDGVLRQVYYQYPHLEYSSNKPHIRVGRKSMPDEQVVENIIDLVHQLGSLHPGGSHNVAKIHLRANGNASTVVDLYVTKEEKAPELKEEDSIEDETETDKLLEPSVQHYHVVCADHYILYEEDDYSRENEERVHFDRNDIRKFQSNETGAAGASPQKAATGAKKTATNGGGAGGNSNEANMNDLILKSLKKMLGAQNLAGLTGNARNNVGGVTANNVIRKRRVNNQQGSNMGGGNYNNGGGNRQNGNRRFI